MSKSKKKITISADSFLEASQQKEMLQVTHAVLVDETCTYSYSVKLGNGETDIITNECGRQYHHDLRQAFRNFDPHLAAITEQVESDHIKDINESEGITESITANLGRHRVNEVKISGDINTGNVQVIGSKLLKCGDEVKLKSPKVALDDAEYEFVNELAAATQTLIQEITLYHEGKSRPEMQLSMFAEPIDEEKVADPE